VILRRCNIDHVHYRRRIADWWNSKTKIHVHLTMEMALGNPATYVVCIVGFKGEPFTNLDKAIAAFNLAATRLEADRNTVHDD